MKYDVFDAVAGWAVGVPFALGVLAAIVWALF